MGSIRVTQRLIADRVLNNLNQQSRAILKLEEQLSTGQLVNRPSDNPLAARRAVNASSLVSENDQYLTNISTIGPTLQTAESAIRTAEDVRQRAHELTVQGLSNTNGQTQRDEIAIEINQLLETMLEQGNTLNNGKYIFSGSRTQTTPFVATRDASGEITAVSYEGNDEHIEVEIFEDVRVTTNETGSAVFTQTDPGTQDIFQVLIDIRDSLRASDLTTLNTNLEQLLDAQDQLLVGGARLGATQNRIERMETNIEEISVQLENVRSDNVDADYADTVINLELQTNALNAALNAGGRVIQASLLDYVR